MTVQLPEIRVTAVCHDCRKQHVYQVQPAHLADAMGQWTEKHLGHRTAFSTPRPLYEGRWAKWLREFWSECPFWAPRGYAYGHNADIKIAYAASAAYTMTLASLATSSTLVAGVESTAIDNTTNKFLDYLVGAKVTVGTTPTVLKTINLHAYAGQNDTPLYPDTIDGTDSAETLTNLAVKSALPLGGVILLTAATSDIGYYIAPFSLASLFGQIVPKFHGLWLTHDTAVNLHATGGNHIVSHTGVYGTAS